MSRHSYADADAKCPFYAEQGSLYVKCEGLTPRGSVMIRYKTGADKERWIGAYCNTIKGCETCPLWTSLWKEWERTHPDGPE